MMDHHDDKQRTARSTDVRPVLMPEPFLDDGWSLPAEPSRGRHGPVLVRSTFMAEIDDGWVLPDEAPALRVVTNEPPPRAPVPGAEHGPELVVVVEDQPALNAPLRSANLGLERQGAEDRLDLNTASALELQTIPGVGQGKASRIVAYREHHGRFNSVDELAKVSGFGARSVAKIADRLTV